jgi:hypothetical protein
MNKFKDENNVRHKRTMLNQNTTLAPAGEAYNYKFSDKNNMLNISMNVWLCDLYMCDVMDITLNSVRVYPIRTSFFYEKYYNDSAFTNQSSYKTLRINDGLGNIIQYNIKKGMIQIQSNNKIWKLYE